MWWNFKNVYIKFIILIKGSQKGGNRMFKHILLAADGSIHSLRAAQKAIELAKLNKDVKVDVVYVVDGKTAKKDVLHNWDKMGIKEKREKLLESTINMAKNASINYEIKILRGEPAPKIVQYAQENNVDIIVIGSRGLNVLQEMVLGSVSHKVAKRATCPIMIVK